MASELARETAGSEASKSMSYLELWLSGYLLYPDCAKFLMILHVDDQESTTLYWAVFKVNVLKRSQMIMIFQSSIH